MCIANNIGKEFLNILEYKDIYFKEYKEFLKNLKNILKNVNNF